MKRIAGNVIVDYREYRQDVHLAENQKGSAKCGDNGIFKGVPVTQEQRVLADTARELFEIYPYDGKYILDDEHLIICQSNVPTGGLRKMYPDATINPLGDWTGGINVDTGATNRKLGSDMADSVTAKTSPKRMSPSISMRSSKHRKAAALLRSAAQSAMIQ